ncbi:MAG: H-NS histone family protein [Candidatus Thiodiazotropha lotti]|nr:H-NS histone family protein [Candidatus Thiodiazotropha lotti]
MNGFVENHTALPLNLEQSSDDDLRKLIADAESILDHRDRERKKEAQAKIQSIAKAHGLSVNVSQRSRRGRPPKKQKS